MSQKKFIKTRIATSLSLILGVTTLPVISAEQAQASTEKDVEVITVTGMRSSIKESTRLKRDASGVVDAISAEDIGKFPDTNLAESLQRITGVSINRDNGEGSQVTVRGFGPQYNMITLNGRTMPGSSLPSGGSASDTRAYSFDNLSSDAVKSVEVYKTGKADVASGGMGATININTAKPLDNPGFVASVGAKAMHDTTVIEGADITPEFSGIVSWTDEEEVFGISLNGSYSKRDSGTAGAEVAQWRASQWDGTIPDMVPDTATPNTPTQFTNAPALGGTHALPSNMLYYMSDRERERTNAQLTLQYRPMENVTATLDYTYANLEKNEDRSEMSIWMSDYKSALTFDDGISQTPVIYREDKRDQAPRDMAFGQANRNSQTENHSIGLQIDWEVNDYLGLTFDFHDSSAESTPTQGYGNSLTTGIGANVLAQQGANYTNGLPTIHIGFNDCDPRIDDKTDDNIDNGGLNCNGILDQDDVGTSMQQRAYSENLSEITQARIDGTYELDDHDLSINFGIEARSMSNHTVQSNITDTMGNWGVENPGELPAGFLTPVDFASVFDDYNTQGGWTQGFRGDAAMIGEWAANKYGFAFNRNPDEQTNRLIEEDVFSAYLQANYAGEINDMPFNLVVGLRYESTDTSSTANIALPQYVKWDSNNDFTVVQGSSNNKENYIVENDYDHFLPNIDFDIDVVENVKLRASYSKTIARPSFGQLSSAATVTGGPTGPTVLSGSQPGGASSGNPLLVPMESSNIDLSAEWYFEDTSYVSVGYYQKDVDNFVGSAPVTENFYGLLDPSAGPRASQAIADLNAAGISVNETSLFSQVAANQLGETIYANGHNDNWYEANVDILPESGDPEMLFQYQSPVNNKSAKIDGWELAVQHFFGETGFGMQANYTLVNGDIGFDLAAAPSVTQFALQGLSDTANVVMMYENYGFHARLAYNWRDSFLNNAARFSSEPEFVEEYTQIDLNIGYEFTENLTVSFEGINLTGENFRAHGRTSAQLWQLEQFGARYAIAMRYNF
ncbi:MAG: TonB-dependent receptor [Litorilituus sp.]|nr:TonB-dependent receptor [Litorilituus sp.]